MVAVFSFLPVAAAQQGHAPVPRELLAVEPGGVGASERGLVEEELADGFGRWPSRDEVDDAGHRSRALLPKERKAIRKESAAYRPRILCRRTLAAPSDGEVVC